MGVGVAVGVAVGVGLGVAVGSSVGVAGLLHATASVSIARIARYSLTRQPPRRGLSLATTSVTVLLCQYRHAFGAGCLAERNVQRGKLRALPLG